MKIKELHEDIERYLLEDCYCPNEIYGTDGFGFTLHYAEDECEKFVETTDFVSCITEYSCGEKSKYPYMLIFLKDKDRICDSVLYDATPNNTQGLINYVKTEEKFEEDHFDKNWDKGIKDILSIADAIMID